MLLRQEVADGVEVLSVGGPVDEHEAGSLLAAVERALAHEPRSVVLDLAHVSLLSDGAKSVLGGLPRLCDHRAPASIVVRPPTYAPDIRGWLPAAERPSALAHVDRRALPRTRIEVDHGPHGPAQARAAVHQRAAELGLDEVCDDVVLLVSEMVTNAIRYAAPPVRLEISSGDQDIVVAVTDGSTASPTPRQADSEAEGGRGMLLVDMLTTEHGVRIDPPGKAVWARMPRSTFDS